MASGVDIILIFVVGVFLLFTGNPPIIHRLLGAIRRWYRAKKYSRGRKLEKENKHTQQGVDSLRFGNAWIDWSSAVLHFLIGGATGAGKSLIMRLLLMRPLQQIATKPNTRAFIFDASGDTTAYLKRLNVHCDVFSFNPFESRNSFPVAVAWDTAKDVTNLARAINFSALLFPLKNNDANPYFINSARLISAAVIECFIKTTGRNWMFSDFVSTTCDRELTEAVLNRDAWGRKVLKYSLRNDKTGDDVFSTLITTMSRYRPIAALWARCERSLSIEEWLSGNSIVMIGYNQTVQETLNLVNEMIFSVAVEKISELPSSSERRIYVSIDEAAYAGPLLKPHLVPYLATNGRKKGVSLIIGMQDFEGLQEAAGEKVAAQIVAQCANKALLRFESHETATWASKLIGEEEILEALRSENTIDSITEQSRKRDVVMASEFYGIKQSSKDHGITGYFISPSIGLSKRTVRPEEVQQVVVSEADEKKYAVQLRRDEDQWFPADYEDAFEQRIGLKLEPEQQLENSEELEATGNRKKVRFRVRNKSEPSFSDLGQFSI